MNAQPAITLRKGQPEDFARLEHLPHALHYDHHLAFIKHALGSRESILAESEGVIVGFAIWDRMFFSRPFMWLMGVHPKHQRQGIASRLIDQVEKDNRGLGLFTSTNQSNTVMQALLEKRGFSRSGILENLDPGDPEIFYFKQL